jgi:hypothetical protein
VRDLVFIPANRVQPPRLYFKVNLRGSRNSRRVVEPCVQMSQKFHTLIKDVVGIMEVADVAELAATIAKNESIKKRPIEGISDL